MQWAKKENLEGMQFNKNSMKYQTTHRNMPMYVPKKKKINAKIESYIVLIRSIYVSDGNIWNKTNWIS